MNSPRLDALERMVKTHPELVMDLAYALKANGYLTQEQADELKRKWERMTMEARCPAAT